MKTTLRIGLVLAFVTLLGIAIHHRGGSLVVEPTALAATQLDDSFFARVLCKASRDLTESQQQARSFLRVLLVWSVMLESSPLTETEARLRLTLST